MAKIDIKDAYYSIATLEQHQKLQILHTQIVYANLQLPITHTHRGAKEIY